MPWWWSAAAGFFTVRGTSQQANSARRRGYPRESAAEKPSTMSFSLDAAISSTKGSSFQVVSYPLKILGTGAVDSSTDSVALSLTIKVSTLSVNFSEVRSKDSVYLQFGTLAVGGAMREAIATLPGGGRTGRVRFPQYSALIIVRARHRHRPKSIGIGWLSEQTRSMSDSFDRKLRLDSQ